MNLYTITLFGKDENGAKFRFESEIELQSDDVARTYASDVMMKRIQCSFVGDWWIGSIRNHSIRKYVLLRDE